MGILKAAASAIGGSLGDQWLEVMEADNMDDKTVFTSGVKIRKGSNTKGTDNTVSNGSVIHVYPNQFMMLVDGGKVVDYTAEEGYYTVNNSSLPSLFNGQFGESLKESFNRIRYGGQTPTAQKVYFINLQEIKGIKFGTTNPLSYFDTFYNADLFIRAFGNYSIKISDPLMFYANVIPKNQSRVEFESIDDQYNSEFMGALQSVVTQKSVEGMRSQALFAQGRDLAKFMSDTLDEDWRQGRGMEILFVGIENFSYTDDSKKLMSIRSEGAMLSDPGIREGYVQGAMARGMEAAGSNAGGAMAGFMGMGMGMNAGGGFMGAASQSNMQQMQMNQANQMKQANQMNPAAAPQPVSQAAVSQPAAGGWVCGCGVSNGGKFCSECGKPRPDGPWTCGCGAVNTGKFCSECGKPRA